MKRISVVALLIMILALLAACAPDSAATDQPGSESTSGGAAEGSGEPGGATTEPTPTEPPAEPMIQVAGAVLIVQTTPTEGVGPKPLFEWEAVDGAIRYAVLVRSSDGQTYWGWSGSETSVYLGGGDIETPPPDDSAGPILFEPMEWGVFAYGNEGNVIGVSALRPIAP